MNKGCICDSPNNKLNNMHYRKFPIELLLLKDLHGYGIIILDKHNAIACFDINYCPICGRKLEGLI